MYGVRVMFELRLTSGSSASRFRLFSRLIESTRNVASGPIDFGRFPNTCLPSPPSQSSSPRARSSLAEQIGIRPHRIERFRECFVLDIDRHPPVLIAILIRRAQQLHTALLAERVNDIVRQTDCILSVTSGSLMSVSSSALREKRHRADNHPHRKK